MYQAKLKNLRNGNSKMYKTEVVFERISPELTKVKTQAICKIFQDALRCENPNVKDKPAESYFTHVSSLSQEKELP